MHLKKLPLLFLAIYAAPQTNFDYPDVGEADELPETSLDTISDMADSAEYPDTTYDLNNGVTEEDAYPDNVDSIATESSMEIDPLGDEEFGTTAEPVATSEIPYTSVDPASLDENPTSFASKITALSLLITAVLML